MYLDSVCIYDSVVTAHRRKIKTGFAFFDEVFHQTSFAVKFDKVILVQNAETAIHMVNDEIGVGIISEYTLNTLAPGCPKYPVIPDISFDIGLFANDLNDLTPAAAEFFRIICNNPTFHNR